MAHADPSAGAAPLAVQFHGDMSTDPDGDALTYAWDLDGDGAFDDSTAVNPTHTYTTTGSVNVRLRVTDSHNAIEHRDASRSTSAAARAHRCR